MGVELDLQYPFSWDVTMWFKKRTSYGVYIHIYTIIPYIYMTIHYHTLYGGVFSRPPISPILMGTQPTW